MPEFSEDNTEGYDADDLAALNTAWERITSTLAEDAYEDLSYHDNLKNWSERLLTEYDTGKRGDELTVWFFAPQIPQ